MNCPACTSSLSELKIDGLKVDLCNQGCGGVWFDRFELSQVDEAHESKGEILAAIQIDSEVKVDHTKKRFCPVDQAPMMRHLFNPAVQIEVDHCPKCAGFWLDLGELATIRKSYPTEELRNEAARKIFSKMFDKDLEAMRNKSQVGADEARRIARMFRFICPSYWFSRP